MNQLSRPPPVDRADVEPSFVARCRLLRGIA
jgi:hypothetical protein